MLESLALDGLEQVIDGAMIECADRILIVGRREHDMSAWTRRTRDLESRQTRHANIEKCDLRLQARQCLKSCEAVLALGDDAQLGLQFRQQYRQLETLWLLVFCNECPGTVHASDSV